MAQSDEIKIDLLIEQLELLMSKTIVAAVKDKDVKKHLTIIINDWEKAQKERKIKEREEKLNSDFE